jgi:hypothetical protein
MGSSARTHDHAEAVLTHRDTRDHLAEGTPNAQITTAEVKEQAKEVFCLPDWLL